MKIDLMRKIDFWVGIPVCFILSFFYNIERIFIRQKTAVHKKILFICISEMGSTILAYSAIKKLKELYPSSELYFLIFDELKDSLNLFDLISKQNILTLRHNSFITFVRDSFSFFVRARKEKIDTIIDLELFARNSNILSYLSGAKTRVGFYKYLMEGLYKGNMQTHKVHYNPHMHISLNYLSLVYALKYPKDIPLTKIPLALADVEIPRVLSSIGEKRRIIEKLKLINPEIDENKNIVILNPNASELIPIRKWPLKNYCELAKKILQRNAYIVITGVNSEKKDALEICQSVNYNERCIDFTGKTTIKELIDLYNVSKIIITNDSGPNHFASLTPIKIIVFFGPETPKIYGTLSPNAAIFYSNFACSPCVSAFNHRRTPCRDNKCLQVIKVDDVFEVVKRELK